MTQACPELQLHAHIGAAVRAVADLDNDQRWLVARVHGLLVGNVLVDALADGLGDGSAIDLLRRHC
jgi:hypothetical protein